MVACLFVCKYVSDEAITYQSTDAQKLKDKVFFFFFYHPSSHKLL